MQMKVLISGMIALVFIVAFHKSTKVDLVVGDLEDLEVGDLHLMHLIILLILMLLVDLVRQILDLRV